MIGRVGPSVRVYCALLLALPLILAPTLIRLAAFGLIVALVALAARVGLRKWLFGIVPAATLVGGMALLSLVAGMRLSDASLAPACLFVGRCYLMYLLLAALLTTTDYVDCVRALERIGIPLIFTTLAAQIFRWFHLIYAEALTLNNARLLRGGDHAGVTRKTRDLALMSSSLITHSYFRAERVAAAMECRGFAGRLSPMSRERIRARDLVAVAVLAAALAAVWVVTP
jgi:cobalt/nickel transport system permease protein